MDQQQKTSDPPKTARLRASSASSRKPLLLLLSIAVVVGGMTFLLADSTGFEYYKHVDEVTKDIAQWRDKRLQLHGFVVPGSIAKRVDRDHQKLEYKFKVENCGAIVDVYFAGVVPDTFKEGAEVVIKGKFDGSTFQSNEVMAKCPSKYAQAGEQQSAMITRCSRESAQKGQ